MADKNLKIGIKSDLREGSKFLNFMKEMQRIADKLSKTLGNFNIGGGDVGPGGVPRGDTAQLRRGPHSGLFKQMTEDKRAMGDMGREVENLSRKFERLSQTASRAGTSMGQSLLVDQYGKPMPLSGGSGAAPGGIAAGAMRSGSPFGSNRPPVPPGGGGPGVPGGGGGGFRAARTGFLLTKLLETVANIDKQQIGWDMFGAQMQAQGSSAMGTFATRMRDADIMPLVALRRLQGGGPGSNAFEKDQFQDIMHRAGSASSWAALMKMLPVGNPLQMLNVGENFQSAFKAATPQGRMNMIKTDIIKPALDAAIQQDVIRNADLQYAMKESPARQQFQRRYGGGFEKGLALRGGMEQDPQQLMATVGAVLDMLGRGALTHKFQESIANATLTMAPQAVQRVMAAQAIGGGNLMGRLFGSGLSAPARGAAGIMAADFAEKSLLRINPETLAGVVTQGGAGQDALVRRQITAGMGALEGVTTGGLDKFQETQNMSLAAKYTNDPYLQAELSKMSAVDLANGAANGPTREQRDAGITPEMLQGMWKDKVNSVSNRRIEGTLPLLEKAEKYGGALKYAKHLQKTGQFGKLRQLESQYNMAIGAPMGSRTLRSAVGLGAKGKHAAPEVPHTPFDPGVGFSMFGQKEGEKNLGGALTEIANLVGAGKPEAAAELFRNLQDAQTPDQLGGLSANMEGLGKALGMATGGVEEFHVALKKFVADARAGWKDSEESGPGRKMTPPSPHGGLGGSTTGRNHQAEVAKARAKGP